MLMIPNMEKKKISAHLPLSQTLPHIRSSESRTVGFLSTWTIFPWTLQEEQMWQVTNGVCGGSLQKAAQREFIENVRWCSSPSKSKWEAKRPTTVEAFGLLWPHGALMSHNKWKISFLFFFCFVPPLGYGCSGLESSLRPKTYWTKIFLCKNNLPRSTPSLIHTFFLSR